MTPFCVIFSPSTFFCQLGESSDFTFNAIALDVERLHLGIGEELSDGFLVDRIVQSVI